MWNPFSKKKRERRQAIRSLHDLATEFAILDELARRGLIYWKRGDQILLLEASLATLMLARGAEGFQHFLNQAASWQNYKLITEAYENHRTEVEGAAVRRAQKDNPFLSPADVNRIRQKARAEMPEVSLEDLDCIKEFDIMVIASDAPSARTATEENGQLLAVGHYDGKRVEMAAFDDVKDQMQRMEGGDE